MSFKVLHPGVSTTIQDLGRKDGLDFGVPISGAMDLDALKWGNKIVGNPVSEAGLEFSLMGPKLLVTHNCVFAATGRGFTCLLNGDIADNNKVVIAKKNDVISFKNNGKGVFGYLVFKGKIDVPLVLGSKSTYGYAEMGGLNGRPLLKGDVISIVDGPTLDVEIYTPNNASENKVFTLFKGPEFNVFSNAEILNLSRIQFAIGNDSNRMGYRLEGNTILEQHKDEIISSGVVPGTLQVPNSGIPIVLMKDGPVTGGYPRIAVIDSSQLGDFAQLRAGERFKFSWGN